VVGQVQPQQSKWACMVGTTCQSGCCGDQAAGSSNGSVLGWRWSCIGNYGEAAAGVQVTLGTPGPQEPVGMVLPPPFVVEVVSATGWLLFVVRCST